MLNLTPDLFLIQFLNGLAYGLLLFLLAAGLSIIFGMMDVMNLAHGSFYMLGAYVGLSALRATENFWLSLLVAPLVVGVVGFAVERLLLRPLAGRGHLDQVLLTFGLALVAADFVRAVPGWGAEVRAFPPPPELAASLALGSLQYPLYRLFVIGMGLGLALALALLIGRTRVGAIVRAGVADAQMVGGLGINISRVFSIVFAVGAALAAFGGVMTAPIVSLKPGMDAETLIAALIVVVVGGLGTLRGAFWGSLLIGEADNFGRALLPDYALFSIYVIMAAVLLLRPTGLFGRKT
ncbi:MAG: branched-chain amino acid ABC transporter permease [Chloroflexi bacterium]|nr:branched-chain amino acid ABC transporter permease [Chloroflexota bacterium]